MGGPLVVLQAHGNAEAAGSTVTVRLDVSDPPKTGRWCCITTSVTSASLQKRR